MKPHLLQKQFLVELANRLKPAGFTKISGALGGDGFRRQQDDVRHEIGIGHKDYDDAVDLEVGSLAVRFDEVEDLVARFETPNKLATPEIVGTRCTVVEQISGSESDPSDPLRGCGGRQRKFWSISNPGDISKAAVEAATYVIELGEPYFSLHSDKRHVLRLLAGKSNVSHLGVADVRAERAIALAYLIAGTDEAVHLSRVKLKEIMGEAQAALSEWGARFFAETESR